MNISQLSEQLKDVPQNRLIDYAKNPNSVVPQFLALAEIQRRQQLSAQAQAPASTVANDVLQQAAPQVDPTLLRAAAMQQAQQAPQQTAQMAQQLPENQPGVAQLPTGMPQGMAAGGIVAFASGGEADDEEDDREMAQLFPQSGISLEDIMAIPKGVRSGISALADKGSQAVQAVRAALPQSYEAAKASQAMATPRGGHKYEAAVLKEAERQGVDPNLALHVLYKETGNLKDPESARSKAGALGVMQLMPKTAAGLGVNPLDPMENIRGGITYLKQMHSKYGDPRTAAAAYNAGPGNVDKALKRQGGLDTLSGETRNYIAGLAQGGSVKHFATGNVVSGTDNPYALYGDIGASSSDYSESPSILQRITQPIRNELMGIKNLPAVAKPVVAAPAVAVDPNAPAAGYRPNAPTAYNVEGFGATQDMEDQEANKPAVIPVGGAATPFAPVPTKSDLYEEALAKSIESQEAEAAQNKKLQLGLSLLGAGAAGLQSGSRYLGQNLGASLAGGVGTYGALKKQEADAAKDLMNTRLGLFKYGASKENAAKEYEMKLKMYADRLGMSEAELAERVRATDLKAKDQAVGHYERISKYLGERADKNYNLTDDASKQRWIQSQPEWIQAASAIGLSPTIGVPQAAIDALKKDPKMKEQFDLKYGAGAADKYLGK